MSLFLKSSKWIRILLFICISSFLLTSLTGLRDINKEGVACRFQARIFDIEKPPPDQKVLVVKELEKQQKIYVVVTKETIIGSDGSNMKFEDLHLEMAIEIEGLKVIEREDGQDNTIVLAKRIRLLVQ